MRPRLVSRSIAAAACAAALAVCARGQDAAPSPADEKFIAAGNLLAAGRFAEAADAFAAFVVAYAGDPRAAEARFDRGEALFRAGSAAASAEERAECYQKALDALGEVKGDPRAAFRVGTILFLLGRTEEAVKALRSAVGTRRLSATLAGAGRYFLARALLSLQRADEARAVLAEARASVSGPSAAYLHLAAGDLEAAEYRAKKDETTYAAALSAYRNALDATTKGRLVPETLFRIGELMRWAGRHDEALRHYTRAVEQHPLGPVAPYAKLGAAWASLGLGDAEGARRSAVGARELSKDFWLVDESHYVEGAALVALKQFAPAVESLAPFLEREGTDLRAPALHRLAWAAVAAGQRERAAAAVAQLLATEPSGELKAEANYLAAEVALQSGDAARAIELYGSARSGSGPTASLAAYRMAAALSSAGDARRAAAAFDEFVASHPDHRLAPSARSLAARSYLAAGEGELALARFGEARAAPANAAQADELMWGASLAEYMRGNFDRMAALDRELLSAHPASPRAADAAYWLAWSHLEKSDWRGAAASFRDAAGRAKGRPDLAASALIEAASALERSGDRAAALATALELLNGEHARAAPVEVALWTAQALREADRNDDAQKLLDRTLERAGSGPDRPRLLYALGQLALEASQIDAAMRMFDDALASSPPGDLGAACRIGRGRALAARGKLAEAEVVFENVAAQSAGWGHASAYVELGCLRLDWAARSDGARRPALAARAAEDFMLVALLYEPEGPGEGARLCARALLGAARAYVFLEKQASALDRIEQLLAHPLYGSLPEAKDARKLLQQLRVPGTPAGGR